MAWDREERDCPVCGKTVRGKGPLAQHMRIKHPTGDADGSVPADEPATASPYAGPVDEPASAAKRPRLRLLGGAEKSPPRPKPAKAKVVHKRVHTGDVATFAWMGAAQAVSRRDVPVGRVLAMQAPFVGDAFDEAVRGTVVDRALQPLARANARAEGLGALIGVPLLVGMMEHAPESRPLVEPLLRQFLGTMLLQLAKGAKAQRKRDEEAAAAMAEMEDVFDPDALAAARAQGFGPIDLVMSCIFAPTATVREPEPEEAMA